MRIIAGELRGREVLLPKGSRARPSTGMVREQLMNILTSGDGQDSLLEQGAFLDLFAASGVTGFEALSRGAPRVIFVEVEGRHAAQISRSAWQFGVHDRCRVLRCDARRCTGPVRKALGETRLAVVFADPPYIPGFAAQFVPNLTKLVPLAMPECRIVVRSVDRLPAELPGMELLESHSGGKGQLFIYGIASAAAGDQPHGDKLSGADPAGAGRHLGEVDPLGILPP